MLSFFLAFLEVSSGDSHCLQFDFATFAEDQGRLDLTFLVAIRERVIAAKAEGRFGLETELVRFR